KPRGAGGAEPRGALHSGARPDRRSAGLREADRTPRPALRRRPRLELSGAGAETVEAFPAGGGGGEVGAFFVRAPSGCEAGVVRRTPSFPRAISLRGMILPRFPGPEEPG